MRTMSGQQQPLEQRVDQLEARLEKQKNVEPEAVVIATTSTQVSTASWIMFGVFVFLILLSIFVPIIVTQVQSKKIQKEFMARTY